LAADTAFRTRFIRESRAAAAVDHPNIIPVYDAGDAGGFLFIAMRYVHGGDVRSLFSGGQRLSATRAWNIVSQVAAALDAAHAHDLIHRDVKPANMLLDVAGGRSTGSKGASQPDETSDHVYLSDFGISKQTLASHLTSTGQFVGTLDYIAPEQIEAQTVDGRADQYSLACATFEMLTGEPPFRRDLGLALINAHLSAKPPSLLAKRPDLPMAAQQVLSRAMAKSPDQRYATCTDFAMNLGRALGLLAGAPDVGVEPGTRIASDNSDQAKLSPATELAAGAGVAAAAGVGASAAQPAQVAVTAAEAQLAQAGTPDASDQSTMYSGPQGHGQVAQQAPWQQGQPGWQQPGPGPQTWPAGGGQAQPPFGNYGAYPQQPGWPGGPSGPNWPQQPVKRSGRAGALIATVLAVLLLGGGGVYAYLHFHKTPTSPPTTSSSEGSTPPASSSSSGSSATANSQATNLSNLLGTSVQTHTTLQNAVLDIEDNCSSLSSTQISNDVAAIQAADNQRQTEYASAQTLNIGALANATTLKSDLMRALNYSLQADDNFLTWAQQEQSGCFVSSQSSAYQTATSDSTTASAAKTAFAILWNGEAANYGQQVVTPGDI
jgi:serine/threonine-protein kinase